MINKFLTEIPREQWAEFVNEFSQDNLGRLTRLEIFGELGAQEEERHLPFQGVSLDQNGADAPQMAIMLGDDARHLTHTVSHVSHLFPKRSVGGRDEALEIESVNGEKTLLQFESATP